MQKNMIIWINNYIDKARKEGKIFINKINMKEKMKLENKDSDYN